MNKIYILDGSGYLFRAYYALPEIKDKEWNSSQAIFGFFKMIFSLLKEQPDYLIIARDSPKQTIRQQNFAEYKINRPTLPDNFKEQIKKIKKISNEIWLYTLETPWYEADDIIFNLVKLLKKYPNNIIYLITSDKDIKQLLDTNVLIKEPMKNQILNKKDFIKQYGFEPKYIVDFLALTWDSSDNIPGVKWIWQKTAQQLIAKYHSIENLYNNLESLPEKIKNLLIKWKDNAFFSKKLIQLMDIPEFKIDLQSIPQKLNYQKAKDILINQLWFKSFEKLISQLEKQSNQKQQLSLF